jgi:hypothetical protein
MLWRVDVKSNHVGGLACELGIIRGQVTLAPVRAQTGALPDPHHHHVIDSECLSQAAAATVGGAIVRRPPSPFQDFGFQRRSPLGHSPSTMTSKQSRQTLILKALFPALDIGGAAAKLDLNVAPRFPIGQPQYQPGALHIAARRV